MDDIVICPGCGLRLESITPNLDDRYRASRACREIFWQLSAFTLSLADTDFIHQVAIDTYTAQHSGPGLKPIATTFALIGLYLVFERDYTGREAQLAHIRLGKKHRRWPAFTPPEEKASMTVLDVLQQVSQHDYKRPIMDWGRSVWETWKSEHQRVGKLVDLYL